MKQVDKTHYKFQRDTSKERWSSMWYQLNEVLRLKPDRVLEIGPGPNHFKTVGNLMELTVETMDLDPELKPDYVGSVTQIPPPDASFDVVRAFQILEHLPYDESLKAFKGMAWVSRGHIVISLPDTKPVWRYQFHIQKCASVDWLVQRPFWKMPMHVFNGEHYWEINKRGYELERVISDFSKICRLTKTYRVHSNPYHRFFVFDLL